MSRETKKQRQHHEAILREKRNRQKKADKSYSSDNSKKASKSSVFSDKSNRELIDAILKSTPAQKKILPPFEEKYNNALKAEDYTQAEALYTPYFKKQIANQLEDLNAWSEAEDTNYERSLRRARFSLAAQGGAIGTERQKAENDITKGHQQRTNNAVRGTERAVGTKNIKNAGYQSAGQNQQGSITEKMKEAIQSGQLWYKNQRAQRYYGEAKTYYSQPSAYALSGDKL